MCYSDIFATMALAAEHARTSVLGTFVLCAGNRAAPVSAAALATINELAPGRVIAGIGSGFSARNVMGMPATPLKVLAEEVKVLRELLAGRKRSTAKTIANDRYACFIPRWVYQRQEPGSDLRGHHLPKATRVVGEVGDGWITVGADPE